MTPVEDQTLKKVYEDMVNDILDLDQINERLRYLKRLNKKEARLYKATVTKRKKQSKKTIRQHSTSQITTTRKSKVSFQ